MSNPFPDQDTTESRKTLGYWNDLTIDMFVLNNRGVNDYEVYNLTPMYSITLTPASIKEIRNYNRQTSYNDFNFDCEDGLYCKSLFLRHSDYSYIVNIDKSCGMSNDWYACDSEQLAANKDSLFNVLRR